VDSGPVERGEYIHERVYQRLRGMIVDGSLAPGERLFETELARTLGVSRTPIREGIRRLLQENWVEMRALGGVSVRKVTARDLVDSYTARAAMEALAARIASERITDEQIEDLDLTVAQEFDALGRHDLPRLSRLNIEFHDGLARWCGNRPLLDALEVLSIHTVHYRRAIVQAAADDPEWQTEYEDYAIGRIRDHARIVDLLRKRDGGAVEEAVRQHVMVNAENLLALLNLDGGEASNSPVLRKLQGDAKKG
jgi:DNA-binding GntR family transcriptional regulator